MPTQLKIEEVHDALLVLVKSIIGGDAFVDGISSEDLTEDGSIAAIQLPAILLLFDNERVKPQRDNSRLTYQSFQTYSLLVGNSSLRDSDEERTDALDFVSRLRDGLSGERLTVSDGTTEPIEYAGSSRYQQTKTGTWFRVEINVGTVVQFSAK